MSYATSGSAGTGTITITNESNATLAVMVTSGVATVNSAGGYYIDRAVTLVNSKMVLNNNNLSHYATGMAYGTRAGIRLDATSELDWQNSTIHFFWTATGADGEMVGFDADTTHGKMNIRRCGLYMGTGVTTNGVYIRAFKGATVQRFEDNQCWGMAKDGPGRIGGGDGSVYANNKFFYGSMLNLYDSGGTIYALPTNIMVSTIASAYDYYTGNCGNHTVRGMDFKGITTSSVKVNCDFTGTKTMRLINCRSDAPADAAGHARRPRSGAFHRG